MTRWCRAVLLALVSLAIVGQDVSAGPVVQSGPRLFVSTPETFDYYIGPSGCSDGNAGTSSAAPWCITALYANASTYAGKKVGLLDGTYVLTSASNPSANLTDAGWAQAVRSTAAGTSGSPTIIKAVHARQAILTTWNGSAYFQTSGPGAPTVLEVQAQWTIIDGLVVTKAAGHGITVAASNITIQNSWIYDLDSGRHTGQADTNEGGIYFRGSAPPKVNLTFRNNKVNDVVSGGTFPGDANCIGDQFGVNGVLLEYNTCYNTRTFAYWKVNAFNVVARYNHVYNSMYTFENWATGQTGGVGTNEIYCNIIAGNNMGGAPSANNNGAAAILAKVYSNTIVLNLVGGANDASSWGGYVVMQGSGSSGAVQYFNNALDLDVSLSLGDLYRWPASTQTPSARITLWDYNANTRFKATDNVGSLSTSSFATWQGAGYDTHSPALAPLGLVDRTHPEIVADMAPGVSSPLLNAGKDNGTTGGNTVNIGHTACGVTPGANF